MSAGICLCVRVRVCVCGCVGVGACARVRACVHGRACVHALVCTSHVFSGVCSCACVYAHVFRLFKKRARGGSNTTRRPMRIPYKASEYRVVFENISRNGSASKERGNAYRSARDSRARAPRVEAHTALPKLVALVVKARVRPSHHCSSDFSRRG